VWLALGKLDGALDPMSLSFHVSLWHGGPAGPLALSGYRLYAVDAAAPDSLLLSLLAVYPVMIPLALAAHFCNQLRDYEEDAAQGVRGLMHALGKPVAVAVCFGLLLLGPLPMLLLPPSPRPGTIWPMAGVALVYWLICLCGITCYVRRAGAKTPRAATYAARPDAESMRLLFRLLLVSGPLLAVTWLWLHFW
jgi:1,4-dihydroxy-2-naphthoate octaprenyltransferase